MPSCCHRFAHQNRILPPAVFRQPSQTPGIVHKSIGLHTLSYHARAAPNTLRILNSLSMCTPWSVFQDGTEPLSSLRNFTFSAYSFFDRSTSTLSVSHLYLALDGRCHPFHSAIPNTATPSYAHIHGAITLSGWSFQTINIELLTSHKVITLGALPSSLAATTGILVSFFSSLYSYA